MTGYFARGTGCCATTSVDFGLYCRMPRSWAAGAARSGRGPPPGARRPERTRETKRRSHAVSRILSAVARRSPPCARADGGYGVTTIPLVPASLTGIKQPTRRLRTGRPQSPPYLVLLRAGFCLPPTLPPARCALTAPFHPYPPPPSRASARPRPFDLPLAVYFLCHCPSGYPARALPGALPCGVRTFLPRRHFACAVTRDARLTPASDRLAWLRLFTPSSYRQSSIARIARIPYPSVSCEILYCSSFLYRLLRGVSIRSAVFEMFQPVSRSFCTRNARSATSLCSRSVPAGSDSLSGGRPPASTRTSDRADRRRRWRRPAS